MMIAKDNKELCSWRKHMVNEHNFNLLIAVTKQYIYIYCFGTAIK